MRSSRSRRRSRIELSVACRRPQHGGGLHVGLSPGMRARGLVVVAALVGSVPVAVMLGGCGSSARRGAPPRLASVASPVAGTTARAAAGNSSTTAATDARADRAPGHSQPPARRGGSGQRRARLRPRRTPGAVLASCRASSGRLRRSRSSTRRSRCSTGSGRTRGFRPRVLGAGHLGPAGVWHGDLYLRGGGDPTFGDGAFNRVWEDGYGPTAEQLVGQLLARGIRRVTGLVIGDRRCSTTSAAGPRAGSRPTCRTSAASWPGSPTTTGRRRAGSAPERSPRGS